MTRGLVAWVDRSTMMMVVVVIGGWLVGWWFILFVFGSFRLVGWLVGSFGSLVLCVVCGETGGEVKEREREKEIHREIEMSDLGLNRFFGFFCLIKIK